MNVPQNPPVALTIAGSDSGGGAGIQVDLKAFAANGAYGTSAISCLTAQNPDGVSEVFPIPPDLVIEQARQVDRFYPIRSIKTGMLYSREIIIAIAGFLEEKNGNCPIVVDPVMVATSGAILLDPNAIAELRESVLPHATLITPNLDEAAVFLGERPETDTLAEAAVAIARDFETAVLLKGGHLLGNIVWDVLATPDANITEWKDDRIENVDTHGSGCTLASAIAARLALGEPLERAVAIARDYLRNGLLEALQVGPRSFINHFPSPPR